MGYWFSTPNNETKTIDADGEVNNNVVIQDGGTPSDNSFNIMILVAIICKLKLIELAIYCYKRHTKAIREKYERNIKLGLDKVPTV